MNKADQQKARLMQRDHWTSTQVCEYLSLSKSRLNRLIKEGVLTPYQIDARPNSIRYFKREQVINLLKPQSPNK